MRTLAANTYHKLSGIPAGVSVALIHAYHDLASPFTANDIQSEFLVSFKFDVKFSMCDTQRNFNFTSNIADSFVILFLIY